MVVERHYGAATSREVSYGVVTESRELQNLGEMTFFPQICTVYVRGEKDVTKIEKQGDAFH